MNRADIAAVVENARVNAANAHNTAQWLRVQTIDLERQVGALKAVVYQLEAAVHQLAARLQDVEDKLS